jgi:hypothetical protein
MPNARDRALDFLTQRYRNSLELVPTPKLQVPVYEFNPGWDLFIVSSKNDPPKVGGSEYVAVHRVSGEVRYLGILGE